MDDEIQLAPTLSDLGKGRVQRGVVIHVDIDQKIRTKAGRQRLNPLAEGIALIGKGQLCALIGQRLGDAPGDRAVIRDPHDETAFALHQIRHGSYPLYLDSSMDPLVPPKPKELVITVSRPAFSTSRVAISPSWMAGSSVSTLIEGAMKSFCSIKRQ